MTLNSGDISPFCSASQISNLFPRSVIIVSTRLPGDDQTLHPEERHQIRKASLTRRMEFSNGRACAREALLRLGAPPELLLSNPDRTVQWPAGIIGSITHTAGYCAAAVGLRSAWRSIGFDAEHIAKVTLDLVPNLLTERERIRLETLPANLRQPVLAITFSAKESFYKCQFPLLGRWFEFSDVEAHVKNGQFRITSVAPDEQLDALGPLNGRYLTHGGLVFTGIGLASR